MCEGKVAKEVDLIYSLNKQKINCGNETSGIDVKFRQRSTRGDRPKKNRKPLDERVFTWRPLNYS